MEPLGNFHWALLSFGVMRTYHYVILQPLALLTQVNIDSIMCPAVSDPFNGPWYRIAANLHQSLFILFHGKLMCFIGEKIFVPKEERNAKLMVSENNETQDCQKDLDANGNLIASYRGKGVQVTDTSSCQCQCQTKLDANSIKVHTAKAELNSSTSSNDNDKKEA